MNIKLLKLVDKINSSEGVIIFGAGSGSLRIFSLLKDIECASKLLFIVDNDSSKWGRNIFSGISVKNPEEIKKHSAVIIIASDWYKEIAKQLDEMAIVDYINGLELCKTTVFEDVFALFASRKEMFFVSDDNKLVNTIHHIVDLEEKKLPKRINCNILTSEQVRSLSKENINDKFLFIVDYHHYNIEKKLIANGLMPNENFITVINDFCDDYFYMNDSYKNNSLCVGEKTEKQLKEMFCPLPFEQMSLYLNSASLCCTHFNFNTNIGNILEVNDLDSIWNSKKAKEFRKRILDGSYYYCDETNCFYLSNNLLLDKCSVEDEQYKKIISQNEVEIKGGPYFLNLGIDQRCNMHCRMCREGNSRNMAFINEHLEDIIYKLKKYDFANLNTLFIAGDGEVFLNSVYLEILQNIKSFKMPNLKKIIIQSNGLLLKKNIGLIEQLSEDYILDVNISVDAATENTYNMIRRGSNFKQVCDGLTALKNLCKKKSNIRIVLTYCLQRLNFREIDLFVDFAEKYGANEIVLQKIMSSPCSESVHLRGNVYYNDFVEIINRVKKASYKKNILLDCNAVDEYLHGFVK